MIGFIVDKAKDKAWSVIGEAADKRIFGGAMGRLKDRFAREIFLFQLYKALFIVQGENAEEFSKDIIEEMKDLVPVDKGNLKNSIRFEKTKGRHGKIIAGDTPETLKRSKNGHVFDEALAVEYGTANMPAQPYFWPPLNKREKAIAARLKRKIEKEFG
jgi:hypothetical protein